MIRRRQYTLLALVLATWLSPSASRAVDPAVAKPLEYRLYYVPSDRPQDWPKQNVPYLPVDREEFDRLVGAANSVPQGLPAAGGAQLAKATYKASLSGDLLVGEARLELAHAANAATLVTLDPLGLALTDARWEDDRQLVLGNQPNGKLAVVVERGGTLVCLWSLRGRRDGSGSLVFPLEIPASTVCQLELKLPELFRPGIDEGVAVADDGGPNQDGTWRFQLGGRTRASLRVDSNEARARPRRLALLQEKTTYHLLPAGIDLTAQLKLDVHREPLRRLDLDLEGPLRIVSVQYAGAELAWSVLADSRPNESHVAIEFPEPLLGPGRIVTVTALAPLEVGTLVKLPRLRVRDVAWQEGEMTLSAAAPFALDALLPQGCRQTKVAPLSAGPPGESVDLQLFSPDASVTVQVARRPARARLTAGATVRFAPELLRAEFRGRIEALEGELFALHADLATGWEIDSVTADRPGVLASWAVDRAVRPAVLTLQLAEAIAAGRPLELMILAHRQAATDRFSSGILEIVHFRDLGAERRLLALEAPANQRIVLKGIDWPRIRQRAVLGDAERALLPSALSDAILEVDANFSDWSVAVEAQTPRFSADIQTTVEIGEGEIDESYRIRCQPDGSRVDAVLVAFSEPRPEKPQFTADDSVGAVHAERLDSEQQAARGVPQAGEVWLVRLTRTASQPFEIQAVRSTPAAAPFVPALASVPEAANQQGRVEIRSADGPPQIESAERLEPTAPPPAELGRSPVVHAAFRYDPLDELAGRTPAALVLNPAPETGEPARADVWRLRLNSHYLASGDARHVAVFDIENHGDTQCVLRLPAGAELLRAVLDETVITRRSGGADLPLILPANRRFPSLVVEFASQDGPLGLSARREAPWPDLDLPISSREWVVSTACQYEPLIWPKHRLAWPARLLGPLARSPAERPFDPVSLRDGKRFMSDGRLQSGAVRRAGQLLETLGRTLVAGGISGENWGQLLVRSRRAEPGPFANFCIDGPSLSAVKVGPSSPVSILVHLDEQVARNAVPALAAESLRADGLALLIDGDQVVLTSQQSAAEEAQRSVDQGRSVIFPRASGQNAADKTAANLQRRLPLSAWMKSPAEPWQNPTRHTTLSLSQQAAQSYCIVQDGADSSSVRLVRSDVIVAAAWALAAAIVSLTAATRRRRSVWLLSSAVAALAAIWLPSALSPLVWGAVFGLLAGFVWLLVRPADRRSASPALVPDLAAAGTSLIGASVGLIVSLSAALYADEAGGPEETEARSQVHRILVPVDKNEEPGTHYQVPTDFLDELRYRASAANKEPRGWLISSASYDCTLARDNLEGPMVVRQLTARYGVSVLSPDARVRLPFRREQTEIVPDSATLDGQPLELGWSEPGDALVCHIFEPGDYELEFGLVPAVTDEAETRGFALSIPPIASAVLEMRLPEQGVAIDLPGVKGEMSQLEGGRKISAHLGPTDSMLVRWPQKAATMPVAEAEELLWLKVRPGSVVLDVTLNLNVMSGALSRIEFAADRRLRLVPGPSTAKERTLPVDSENADVPQTTQLDLSRPLTGQTALRLSFFMTGASGVGNIRLPVFHTLNARVVRRWLAVTVNTGLEYEARDSEQLETLPTAEFVEKWGEADVDLRDALVYRLSASETAWNLSTRSREPQTTVKESLSLSFQRTSALVRYDAQLMTSAGFVFQHRLSVPPELDIERISLEHEGIDRVVRWARGEPGIVTVFLNRRITSAQQLTLVGRLPVRANGRVALPRITIESGTAPVTIERAEVLSRSVHLYRQPRVRVALEEATGLTNLLQPAPGSFDGRLGRLVSSHGAENSYSGTIVVTPNEPATRDFEQFTFMRFVDQGWAADVDFRFVVEKGLIDTLRFELPATWAAHCEVLSPPSVVELSDELGKNRKALTVRPLQPLTGECRVQLRATLTFSPGETVTAPDVVALGLPAGERYWLLPQQVGIEAVSWDVQRMVSATLPDSSSLPAEAKAAAVFQAVGERPQAVMSTVKAAAGLARVRLADVRLAVCGDGLSGAAAFDLEPAGHAVCPLELASGWRLVQVSVGGVSTTPRALAPGKWEIPLRSDRLPQRLEVTFAREDMRTLTRLSLPIVAPRNWPVEETLLTLHAPERYRFEVDAGRLDNRACDLERLSSVVELTNLPDETAATTANDDLAAWYRPWARWLLFCGRQTELADAPVADAVAGDHPTLLRDNWVQAAKRLHLETVLEAVAKEPMLVTQSTELWQQLHERLPSSRYHWSGPQGTGGQGPTEVRVTPPPTYSLDRLGETAWIGLFLLTAFFLPRQTSLADILRRWPHAFGVGLGLLWWLFCQPSALGWLVIACSLAVGLRSAVYPSWVKSRA
ncbi:MAG TPA: hypothetical protein VHC22_28105 [Pirellulales bacterium]|nr:hypothetical protein [Pirellulales bacterium]